MSEIVTGDILDAPAEEPLGAALEAHARLYLDARRRTGQAILDAAAAVASARTAVRYGQWRPWLRRAELSESGAQRLIDIHQAAEKRAAFADKIRAGLLGLSIAGELAQGSEEVLERLLLEEQPPTIAQIRAEKRALAMSPTSEDLPSDPPALAAPTGDDPLSDAELSDLSRLGGWRMLAAELRAGEATHTRNRDLVKRGIAPNTPEAEIPTDWDHWRARAQALNGDIALAQHGAASLLVAGGRRVTDCRTWPAITARIAELERRATPTPALDRFPPGPVEVTLVGIERRIVEGRVEAGDAAWLGTIRGQIEVARDRMEPEAFRHWEGRIAAARLALTSPAPQAEAAAPPDLRAGLAHAVAGMRAAGAAQQAAREAAALPAKEDDRDADEREAAADTAAIDLVQSLTWGRRRVLLRALGGERPGLDDRAVTSLAIEAVAARLRQAMEPALAAQKAAA